MLILPDSWSWDLWLVDDGPEFHLFFQRASKALLYPDRRHWRASVGHAVSPNLRRWTLLPDALVHLDAPDFDDIALGMGTSAFMLGWDFRTQCRGCLTVALVEGGWRAVSYWLVSIEL